VGHGHCSRRGSLDGRHLDGSYGVPKGLCFSYPVTCANGQWKIVQNLNIDAFSQAKLKVTIDELLEEKGQALAK